MNVQTEGTVISAEKQWWFKVNRKPVRRHSFDGAEFPYIIKVRYTVGGAEYIKGKWIWAGKPVPGIGTNLTVFYNETKPSKAKVIV